jgi:MFS transporter, PPP family, 3-phenylpropionic acid transporter
VTTRIAVRPSVAVHGLFVVFGFVIAAFFPFLAIYLEGRGLTSSDIGLVIASMAVARVVFNPVWGHLADTKIGRLTALQIGTVGAAAGAAVLIQVDTVAAIAAVSFVIAGFMVATGPNLDSIAMRHLGDERLSDYGRIRGWESLAYAGGCLVFGAVLEANGIHWAMPIYAATSIAVLAWSTLLPRDRPAEVEVRSRLGSVGAVFREAPRFWGFLAALFLVWTGFNAAWNFIALKIVSEGGGPLLIGIGTALGGLVEVPVMRASSRMHTRWGVRRTYVLGCVVYATGFLLWGLISNPTIVSVLTVFDGMAFGLLFTTGVVIVGRLLPSSLYSTGNSVAGMVGFGLGPIIGAGIGGFVYQHAGPVTLYCGASALAIAGGATAWFTLNIQELDEPGALSADDLPADPHTAPPEPLG